MRYASRSVRVDDDSYRRLIDYSRREDRPISRVLRAAVEAYEPRLPRDPDEGYRGPYERAGASAKPSWSPPGPTAEVMRRECPHDRTRKLKWGTVCASCGTVVR